MDRSDWKGSPYLFGSSSGPRIKPLFAPLVFAGFAGLLVIGWAQGVGTGNRPMASLAFEPLYSAHALWVMIGSRWENRCVPAA